MSRYSQYFDDTKGCEKFYFLLFKIVIKKREKTGTFLGMLISPVFKSQNRKLIMIVLDLILYFTNLRQFSKQFATFHIKFATFFV